jgi:hypothetical protein
MKTSDNLDHDESLGELLEELERSSRTVGGHHELVLVGLAITRSLRDVAAAIRETSIRDVGIRILPSGKDENR